MRPEEQDDAYTHRKIMELRGNKRKLMNIAPENKTDLIARCGLCGEPMPKGEEMFKFHGYSGRCPSPPLPRAPIEEQIVAVFADFRARRLKNMVNNPDSITDDSQVPEELSRLAEARAVYDVVKRDLGR